MEQLSESHTLEICAQNKSYNIDDLTNRLMSIKSKRICLGGGNNNQRNQIYETAYGYEDHNNEVIRTFYNNK